jgi:hypothetical protein
MVPRLSSTTEFRAPDSAEGTVAEFFLLLSGSTNRFPQGRPGCETGHLAGRDLQPFTGVRVPAGAGFSGAYRVGGEANQGDSAPFLPLYHDGLQPGRDGRIGFSPAQSGLFAFFFNLDRLRRLAAGLLTLSFATSLSFPVTARGLPAFASEQCVEAPVAALRGHVHEDEIEQDGGHALVLN